MATLALVTSKLSSEARQIFILNGREYYGAVKTVGAVASPFYSAPGDVVEIPDDLAAAYALLSPGPATGGFTVPVDYNPLSVYTLGNLVRYNDTVWAWFSLSDSVPGNTPGSTVSWQPCRYRPDLTQTSQAGGNPNANSNGTFTDATITTLKTKTAKIEDSLNPGNFYALTVENGLLKVADTPSA